LSNFTTPQPKTTLSVKLIKNAREEKSSPPKYYNNGKVLEKKPLELIEHQQNSGRKTNSNPTDSITETTLRK
jgi:hypothetical protein